LDKNKGAGMSEVARKVQTDYIENVLLLLTLFENWQKSPHRQNKTGSRQKYLSRNFAYH
jgi:hypothetical protein